ncbi:zinc-binding alcohol dehydrogenase family protein [Chitinivorax sp. PXF-14]|uniref:quinone oxidoreductase family protein n=1 Tax=Chitinivorax sp. PXF-14 TaxID=3230488 RepID=UPI0034675017
MKALQFAQTGSLDNLSLVDLPRPTIAVHEALVEVHAAGLNPSDVKNVLGRFPYTTLPRIPGRDFAGIVVEGPQEWLGQPVWGTGNELGFSRDGSHANYLALPVSGLSRKPAALSFAQAAACGVPFTTALNALDRACVGAGTKLLVIGAAGAVGRAAVQLAQLRGAQVVAAVRQESQLQRLQQEGMETLLLGGTADLATSVKQRYPHGADVIFDTTGAWLAASVEALARFGRIAVIAAPADGHVNVPVLNLYRRGGSIVGINSLLYDSTDCAAMLTQLAAHFDSGKLQAPADLRSIPLEQGHDAYMLTDTGGAAKIVLDIHRPDPDTAHGR